MGQRDKLRGIESFRRRNDADQVVGNLFPERLLRLAGEDDEARIDLIGIRTNNFAADLESQFGGEDCFADPGGAGNDDG